MMVCLLNRVSRALQANIVAITAVRTAMLFYGSVGNNTLLRPYIKQNGPECLFNTVLTVLLQQYAALLCTLRWVRSGLNGLNGFICMRFRAC